MATKLRKLRITHVAAVDRGANQHAHVLLWKRHDPLTKDEGGGPRTVNQLLAEREAREQWWELQRALEGSVQEIMEHATPEEQTALLTQTLGEFSARALALIPQMQAGVAKRVHDAVDDLAKAGRVIAANRLERLKAAMAALSQIIREAEPEEKEGDMADAAVEKRAADAEARVKELEAQLAKGDPEALAKRVEAAEQRAKDAETIAKAAQAEQHKRDYIAKAATYQTLPLKPEEDWAIFKAIDSLGEEHKAAKDRILDLFQAADGQLAIAGALGMVGKGGERRGGVTAWDEAKGLAGAIIAKSAGMDLNTAVQQVWRERPDLYERHRLESRDRS